MSGFLQQHHIVILIIYPAIDRNNLPTTIPYLGQPTLPPAPDHRINKFHQGTTAISLFLDHSRYEIFIIINPFQIIMKIAE